MRAVSLLALLLGPLLGAEIWARTQLDLLYPYISDRRHWSETKLLLLDRAGCPQVLALGSSLTNRSMDPGLAGGATLVFGEEPEPVEKMFTFGLVGGRTSLLYAAWRHIEASGCVPAYVFVEVSPPMLRSQRGSTSYEPYLDAATLWRLPRGFARAAGLSRSELFEAATWDRLLLHRRRLEFRQALIEAFGIRPFSGSEDSLALDGVFKEPAPYTLLGENFAREQRRRQGAARKRGYNVRISDLQTSALRLLIEEASTAGSRVVLHTPPATRIYRDIVAKSRGNAAFCAFYRELVEDRSIEWYWSYGAEGFGRGDFMDWVHLNRTGGERYIRQLFAAVREPGRPQPPACSLGASRQS